ALHHSALLSFPTRRSSDLEGDLLGSSQHHEFVDEHPPNASHLLYQEHVSYAHHYLQHQLLLYNQKEPYESHLNANEALNTRLLRSEEHTSELQSRFDLVCR